MPEFNVRETLEEVAKAKTREDKREVLKKRENLATKALLQLNFIQTQSGYFRLEPHHMNPQKREIFNLIHFILK